MKKVGEIVGGILILLFLAFQARVFDGGHDPVLLRVRAAGAGAQSVVLGRARGRTAGVNVGRSAGASGGRAAPAGVAIILLTRAAIATPRRRGRADLSR